MNRNREVSVEIKGEAGGETVLKQGAQAHKPAITPLQSGERVRIPVSAEKKEEKGVSRS